MLLLIAETTPSADPWWLSALTGSGGALVALVLWVRHLTKAVEKKDQELLKVSSKSIECITQVVEKNNQDKEWKQEIKSLLDNIKEYIKSINSDRK